MGSYQKSREMEASLAIVLALLAACSGYVMDPPVEPLDLVREPIGSDPPIQPYNLQFFDDQDSGSPIIPLQSSTITINGKEYSVDESMQWSKRGRVYVPKGQTFSFTVDSTSICSRMRRFRTSISTERGATLSINCGGASSSQELTGEIRAGRERKNFDESTTDISLETSRNRATIIINSYQWLWSDSDRFACVVTAVDPDGDTTTTTTTVKPQTGCRCGMKNTQQRIIGGVKVTGRELPWQVRVYMTDKQGDTFSCGGSVVSKKHVVTAAHCTAGMESLVVIPGADDVTQGSRVNVAKWTDHPQYNTRNLNNDISVLELATELAFDESISPICLPDVDADYAGKTAVMSGYGLTGDFTDSSSTTSNELMKIEKKVGTNTYCSSNWGGLFDADTKICDVVVPGKSTCKGDSGGPMQVKVGDNYHLVGVVSFGSARGCLAGPSVFAKAQAYVSWVQGVVSAGGDGFCPR